MRIRSSDPRDCKPERQHQLYRKARVEEYGVLDNLSGIETAIATQECRPGFWGRPTWGPGEDGPPAGGARRWGQWCHCEKGRDKYMNVYIYIYI